MTLEAACILPFFLITVLSFLSFIEIMLFQNQVTMALRDAGMPMCVYGYAYDSIQDDKDMDLSGILPNVALSYGYVGSHVEKFLGEEYLDDVKEAFNLGLIHYYNSSIMEEGDVIELVADFSVTPRFNIIGLPSIKLVSRYYGRAWTGYDLSGSTTGEQSEQNVYITKEGDVYHISRYCTHLQLTISSCLPRDLASIKNNNGQLYRACFLCGTGGNSGKYYITRDGDCYHRNLNCSGLRRTVDVVPISKVGTRGRCSRCGG